MRLYIIRHADPDYSIDSLTPKGHLEAKALAPRMARIAPDRLYVSPLGRAKATCAYTEQALGMTAAVLPWTRELGWRAEVGGSQPMAAWDWPAEAILTESQPEPTRANWHEHPAYAAQDFSKLFAPLVAESDAFLAAHGYVREGRRYRIVKPTAEKIAVFCHGGFGLTWLSHLLSVPTSVMWGSFFLGTSSVTCILMDERSKEWAMPRAIYVADQSHLFAAGLEPSTAGIKANVV